MFIRMRNSLINLTNVNEISVEEMPINFIHIKFSGRGIERSIRVKDENKKKLIDTLLRELSIKVNTLQYFDLHEFLDEIESRFN